MDFIVNSGKIEFLIILAMLPALVLGFIVYKKDVVEKEPIALLLKLFIFGILAAGVALFIESSTEKMFSFKFNNDIIEKFFQSFFLIAFTEELIKWFFTYVICWNRKEFNYNYDAIVYTVFISLGFATIENIFAVLASNGDLIFIIKRGLITVPSHAFFAILSGYYLGKARKYHNRNWHKRKIKNTILSILLPVLAHGLFDFLLFMSSTKSIFILIIFVSYLYVTSYYKVNKTSKETKPINKE